MKSSRLKKILLWTVVSALGLTIAGVLGISLKVGWSLTHPVRQHTALPASAGKLFKPREVSFPSRQDKIVLRGWFLPSGNSNKTIIFAHGYGKNRLQDDVPADAIAVALRDQGYNILMFDFRGCGESGGDLISIGQYEKEDLISAVDFMKKIGRQGDHIGVIGFSMGAVAGITAAAEDPRIEALVADAPFADLEQYLTENLPVWSQLPSFPFTQVILNTMPAVLHLDPHKVSPKRVVGKIKAPILFIHGTADTTIPISNSESVYRAAPGRNRLWIVPGAKHVGSYKVQPKEYMQHVLDLFGQMK